MLYRPTIGGIAFLIIALASTACSSSEPVRKEPVVRMTVMDNRSGMPLDSARVWNRRAGDTTQLDPEGQFVLQDPSPALYVFAIDGYGYHKHRHFSLLVKPSEGSIDVDVPLRPKQLTLDCQSARVLYREDLKYAVNRDSNGVRLRLIDTLARNGQVRIQPAVVNNLSVPVFLPDNFGAAGHYSIRLVDENGTQIDYEFKKGGARSQVHRIYSKPDILPIVPGETERLSRSTLLLQEEVKKGTAIYAHLEYDFSLTDTLEATPSTTFPRLSLDSLHYPIYDTLRVSDEIRAADSLVVQQDTTKMEITGIDTTVTRNGYLLYSTYRENNAAPTAEAARSLLFIPDSVKERAHRDSLEREPPIVSTPPNSSPSTLEIPLPRDPILHLPLRVVLRTDRSRLDSLLRDSRLVDALSEGLPEPEMSADSLLNLSPSRRSSHLSTPNLQKREIRRGITTSSSPSLRASSSLHRTPDSSLSLPSLPLGSPTLASPSSLAPDSIPIDSLPLTIPAEADSVVTDSVVTASLSSPPRHSYWFVPDSLTTGHTQVMVIDSTFQHLRAQPHIDTTYSDLEDLIPARLEQPDSSTVHRFPQQVITVPKGGYRSEYLQTWKQQQEQHLQPHYCQIYPFPLETLWRTTAMH